jgi:F0F1-type ATP synthase assembly protein I
MGMGRVVDFVGSLICASHVLFFVTVVAGAVLVGVTPSTGADTPQGAFALFLFSLVFFLGLAWFGKSLIRDVPHMWEVVLTFAIAGMFIAAPVLLVIASATTHAALNALFPGLTPTQAVLGSIAYAAFAGGLTLYAVIAYTCYKHRCTWELINRPRGDQA